jgi:segregation and condensation protein B
LGVQQQHGWRHTALSVALAGREISRDVVASLKCHGLIDGAIRALEPGAPFPYVTTRKFLEAFGFASLRDLPDIERLEAEDLLQNGESESDLEYPF